MRRKGKGGGERRRKESGSLPNMIKGKVCGEGERASLNDWTEIAPLMIEFCK